MTVHENSRRTYGRRRGEHQTREELILAVLKANGPATDRQVMRWLGRTDPNTVRPRITELICKGYLQEKKKAGRCAETGELVRVVWLADRQMTLAEID